MKYEFDDTEASVIASIGNISIIIGFLLSIGGVELMIETVISDYQVEIMILRATQGIFEILIGLAFFLPALAFRRVHTTEGNDISELLLGMDRWSTLFSLIFTLLVVIVMIEVALVFL